MYVFKISVLFNIFGLRINISLELCFFRLNQHAGDADGKHYHFSRPFLVVHHLYVLLVNMYF